MLTSFQRPREVRDVRVSADLLLRAPLRQAMHVQRRHFSLIVILFIHLLLFFFFRRLFFIFIFSNNFLYPFLATFLLVIHNSQIIFFHVLKFLFFLNFHLQLKRRF